MADYTREPRITNSSKNSTCGETGEPILKGQKCLYLPSTREVYSTSSIRYSEYVKELNK